MVILFPRDLSPLTDNHCAPPDVTGLSERSQVASVRGLPRGYTHTNPSSAMDTADGESSHRHSNSVHLPLDTHAHRSQSSGSEEAPYVLSAGKVSFHAMCIHRHTHTHTRAHAVLTQIHECVIYIIGLCYGYVLPC